MNQALHAVVKSCEIIFYLRDRSRCFGYFCLILLIVSSKGQIGRGRVFHLQNYSHIATENDFPVVQRTFNITDIMRNSTQTAVTNMTIKRMLENKII